MLKSLFANIPKVKALLEKIKDDITHFINGKREQGAYISDEVCTPEYSIDGSWSSASSNDSHVIAEIVSEDSPLPIKDRGSFKAATGRIVKIGMKKVLKEGQIQRMNSLINLNKFVDVVTRLFNDRQAVVVGVKEMQEALFLEGISKGQIGISNDYSEEVTKGELVRVDYGYLPENKFSVAVKWGETGYKPITDIVNMMAAIEGSPKIVWARTEAIDLIRNSDEAAELFIRQSTGFVPENAKLLHPTKEQFYASMLSEYGITFRTMDRTVVSEDRKTGKRTTVKPFDKNVLIFLTQDTLLGRIVYSDLAESGANQVNGVSYETFETFIQLSQFSVTEPFEEVTRAQARFLPVIDGVEDIYMLQINEVNAVEGTDSDTATFDVTEDNKDNVKTALANSDITTKATTVTGLTAVLNKLNEEQFTTFLAEYNALPEPEPETP